MNTRNAAVEGRFYPSTKRSIFDQIQAIERENRYPASELNPVQLFGAVLPHAGHIYSGYQTIPFFQMLKRLELYPETFVIVHPNHSGIGLPLALDDSHYWANSVGKVPTDHEFASALDLDFDAKAHFKEHSAEVIIPFLQYYLSDHPFSILPICMMDQSLKAATMVAEKITKAVQHTGRNIMVLASCDFSHFLSPEEGHIKDQFVLENILSRDSMGVEKEVKKQHISVCGYGPIMVLMEYASSLNPEYEIEILARGHSGEVTPSREVVDYISLILYQ